MSGQLAALRAEVERMLADVDNEYGSPLSHEHSVRAQGAGMAFAEVLDLIDKHAREGQ